MHENEISHFLEGLQLARGGFLMDAITTFKKLVALQVQRGQATQLTNVCQDCFEQKACKSSKSSIL